jgi:hypothetical protein
MEVLSSGSRKKPIGSTTRLKVAPHCDHADLAGNFQRQWATNAHETPKMHSSLYPLPHPGSHIHTHLRAYIFFHPSSHPHPDTLQKTHACACHLLTWAASPTERRSTLPASPAGMASLSASHQSEMRSLIACTWVEQFQHISQLYCTTLLARTGSGNGQCKIAGAGALSL